MPGTLKNVTLRESYVETEYFTGYNNKWGYRLPKVLGIKAGSTFTYTFDGIVKNEKIEKLMKKGIGDRKSEGFGRFVILSDLSFDKFKLKEEKFVKEKIKLNSFELEQMNLIAKRIYIEKLNNNLSKIVLNLNNKLNGAKNIKDSQWGKLYRMMFLLEGMGRIDGIEKIEKYFDNINNKKLNRDLTHAFKNIKIDSINMKEFLLRELKNSESKTFDENYCKTINIGSIKSDITQEEMYRYKLIVFKELFRLQLKDL